MRALETDTRSFFTNYLNNRRFCGFFCYVICSFCFFSTLTAQDPEDFTEEVDKIQTKYDSVWDSGKDTYVFTGSSSIRLWENLEEYFPEHQIVNSGFGGSETSDLLEFIDPLVLRYNPKKVFIYEGDNDISRKKKPKEVIIHFEEVISQIKNLGTANTIVIISAKPSIERWHLKGKYKRLNRRFKKMCAADPLLEFADVWTPMLVGRKLREDLFIEDGLHMNDKGYVIWYDVLKKFIN